MALPRLAFTAAFRRKLNRTDRLTLGHQLLFAGLVVFFAPRMPAWPLLILPSLAMIGLLWFLVSSVGSESAPAWRFLRALYPVVFIWASYAQTGALNRMRGAVFHDGWLRQLDWALFGCEPAVEFARAFPQAAVAEAMHGVYFSYYLLFPGLALLLHLRQTSAILDDYLATLSRAFYFCCLAFVFFPAVGPIDAKASTEGLFPGIMSWIYRSFEVPGGAFPSSHVAVSVVTLAYAIRHAPRWRIIFVPACLGILPATVYCSYHYVVDVLAGIVVALAALALARSRTLNFP